MFHAVHILLARSKTWQLNCTFYWKLMQMMNIVAFVKYLFELQFNNIVSLWIYSGEEQQLERLKTRNNYNEEEAKNRISSQMALAVKVKRATHIIQNTGTLQDTEEQVSQIYRQLCASRRHWIPRIILITCVLLMYSGAQYVLHWNSWFERY